MIEDALGITKYAKPSESTFTQFSLVDNPIKLMSNWFENDTQNLVTGSTHTYDLLTNLLGHFADIVGIRYRYFKSDIEVAITIRASAQYYGSLVVSWYPGVVSADFAFANSDPVIIDITTGGTYIVQIPFSSVYEAYDVTTLDIRSGYVTPRPMLYIYCPYVRSVNSTQPTAQYTLMNRFVNPIFYGTTTRSGVAQMNNPVVEGISATNVFANPYVSAGTAALVAEVGLGSPVTRVAGQVMSYWKEANQAYKTGKDAADAGRGMYGAMKDAVRSMFARDVKEEEAAGEVRNAPTPTGFLPSMTYTSADILDPGSAFRIPPVNLADHHLEHYLKELMQIRTIHHDLAWTSTAQDDIMGFHPMLMWYNTTWGWPYSSFFSQFFRYWRGSYDVDLLFFTSPLVTARFVINAYTEGPTNTKPLSSVNASFHFLKRVDVAGFTKVSLRIPFVFPSQWSEVYPFNGENMDVSQSIIPSKLNIHLESPITGGGDQSPQVYMMVLLKAGPDFQVRSFCGDSFYHYALEDDKGKGKEKIGVAQMHVRSMECEYENMFQGENPYSYRELPEDYMSVEDCCLRWSSRQAVPLQPFLQSHSYDPVGDSFDHLVACFRYARGCVQVKAVRPTEFPDQSYFLKGTPLPGVGDLDNMNSGEYRTYLSLNPVITFEMPMLAHTDWFVVHADTIPGPSQWPIATSDSSLSDYYARAGRGFQIAFLNPPMSAREAVTMFST